MGTYCSTYWRIVVVVCTYVHCGCHQLWRVLAAAPRQGLSPAYGLAYAHQSTSMLQARGVCTCITFVVEYGVWAGYVGQPSIYALLRHVAATRGVTGSANGHVTVPARAEHRRDS
jgi:hypothetical protein